MAKKSVASLKSGQGKDYTKVITAVRSPKTGAYSFKALIAHNDQIKAAVEAAKEIVEATPAE